ncbi:MAG TPA: putative phage abortive infection protein [Chryseolinea sp.]|nr:putative phage abortive infection protein [Chryseolinea sp.]
MEKLFKFFESKAGFLTAIGLILGIFIFGGAIMYFGFYRSCPSDAGTFGDMFGVITSLFSALTVILVFYAARLQKKELNDTRDEMKTQTGISLALSQASKKQSEAAIEQSKASIKQNKNLVLQRFENTFFNLITIHNQNVENLKHAIGSPLFPSLYTNMQRKFQMEFTGIPNFFTEDYGDFIRWYNTEPQGGENLTLHYFKHITNILTFIKDATLSEKRRSFYLNTFLALLSSHELTLLYFHVAFYNKLNDRSKEVSELRLFCLRYKVFDDVENLPNDTYKNIVKAWSN